MDQQNWATKLLGYRFDIIYKTSLENKGANVLSRMYEEGELKAMAHHPIWPEGKAVIEEVHHDDILRNIIEALQQNKDTKPGYSYRGGVLLYKGRLVISTYIAQGISLHSLGWPFWVLSHV